jgi:hypothetical protein
VIFSLEGSESGVWQVIQAFGSLLAITFVTIFVHELIHDIAFAAFGGSPRYEFKVKYLLPLAYATSPGNLFHLRCGKATPAITSSFSRRVISAHIKIVLMDIIVCIHNRMALRKAETLAV